jgi:hypothetical protein
VLQLSSVFPTAGPIAGGTAVALAGNGFEAGVGVTIGGIAATGCIVSSATNINCTTPAGTAGAKDVVVTKGASTSTLAGGFSYVASAVVTIVAPANNSVVNAPPGTVTLSATASATGGSISKVEFFNGATLLGTVNASPFDLPLSGLASGNYNITAKATSNVGGTAVSTAIALKVNAVPTVSITAPANNAVFPAPGAFSLNANAADSDGTIANVQFFNGATSIGIDSLSPYSVPLSGLAAGTYTYTARATDNNGAVTTSAPIVVIVNSLPAVTVSAPTVVQAPGNLPLSATAADTDGTITKVEFFHGTLLLGTDTTSPYDFTLVSPAAGIYSITAKATDNRGGVTASAPVSVTVNAQPAATLTSPPIGAGYFAPATIPLAASASDSDGSIARVEFYQGATLIGTALTAPYNVSWSGVLTGTYSITAKAIDSLGGTKVSPPVSVTVYAAPVMAPVTYSYDELGRLIGVAKP